MNFPATVEGLEQARLPDRDVHLAIGMFDGVHRGHRSVIENAIDSARRGGGIAAVLTFWPHPSFLFQPKEPVLQIMMPELKERVLRSLGVDLIIEQPFTSSFASIPAEEFVPHLRRHLPGLRAIYIGENWRFGKGRSGDARLLAARAREFGIDVVSAARLQHEGQPISSTRIRACIARGEIAAANDMLGYPYFSEATVTEGRKVGRTIGFPTLNLPWNPPLKPCFGVYAVRVSSAGDERRPGTGNSNGETLPGVANYGFRPTVSASRENDPLLEVFLFGEDCPFSTGDRLHVEWLEFLRPEKKFADLAALKAQIARDIEKARQLPALQSPPGA